MEKTSSQKRVKLSTELSELELHKGQVGIICNSWREPTPAYEVEFETAGISLRVLLLAHQVNVVAIE